MDSFPGAGRVVEFEIEEVVELPGVPFRWRFEAYSPFNPAAGSETGREA